MLHDSLVRYVSTDNALIQYGEPIVYSPGTDIIELVRSGKLEVRAGSALFY